MNVNIRIFLKGRLAERFLAIKKALGLKANTEAIRFLIKNFKF